MALAQNSDTQRKWKLVYPVSVAIVCWNELGLFVSIKSMLELWEFATQVSVSTTFVG